MKTNLFALILITISSIIIYRNSFYNFFTQDDFILTYHFSQNNLTEDIINTLGPPQVTHWRPLHNLYFLISGNLFDKNYLYYHLFTFLIHMGIAFLVFKVVDNITKNQKIALVSSFIYAVHPAHFVTLFWISGSATSIGFLFLVLSFYLYLQEKTRTSILSFVLSLLASEAMVIGAGLFFVYQFLFKDDGVLNAFTKRLILVTSTFVFIRFLFLTPQSTYNSYQVKIWPQIVTSTKYYLLRIAGFAEVSGDLIVSIALLGLLLFITINLARSLKSESNHKVATLGLSLIILGLFPFVFISNISAHYMNISVFGFAILIGFAISKLKPIKILTFLVIFLIISFFNVDKTYENHWVIQRSNLAQRYIQEIESFNVPERSTIIFNDNYISTSEEAYISLGTGKAIDFLFKGRNYQYCFTAFESCEEK